MTDIKHPAADVQRIIDSAARLGVELTETETLDWLAAMTEAAGDSDVTIDASSGTFGHKVAMLDFSPKDLERFRRIGTIVEVLGEPGDDSVESALALSGSAAQSHIQAYPGDADFFQRLNIKAETREDACLRMAHLMRKKVLDFARSSTYQFLEAKLGSYPFDCTHRGNAMRKGSPMSWNFDEVSEGILRLEHDGATHEFKWHEVALDPGWCKLDWVVVDEERGQLTNASNVIDVTWEGPSGEIVALDGYLDAFFQEVYLEADDAEMFEKVTGFVSDDALDEYVERLEQEVHKFLTKSLNYGKAAKRMYNVFRLSGKHLEAAFVRQLFDEPATILYQVWSLITTLDNATQPGSSIPLSAVRDQADALVLDVIEALEGSEEVEIVSALLQLRRSLEDAEDQELRLAKIEAAESRVINVVNTFFRDRLTEMPTIKDYIEEIQSHT